MSKKMEKIFTRNNSSNALTAGAIVGNNNSYVGVKSYTTGGLDFLAAIASAIMTSSERVTTSTPVDDTAAIISSSGCTTDQSVITCCSSTDTSATTSTTNSSRSNSISRESERGSGCIEEDINSLVLSGISCELDEDLEDGVDEIEVAITPTSCSQYQNKDIETDEEKQNRWSIKGVKKEESPDLKTLLQGYHDDLSKESLRGGFLSSFSSSITSSQQQPISTIKSDSPFVKQTSLITSAVASHNQEFLKDIHPREKRTFLALHATHVEEVKRESRNEFQKRLLLNAKSANQSNKHPTAGVDSPTSTVSSVNYPSSLAITLANRNVSAAEKNSEEKATTKKRTLAQCETSVSTQPSSVTESSSMDGILQRLITLHEPRSLRLSMYQKFINSYLYYYNHHNSTQIMNNVVLPCSSPNLIRNNKLWVYRFNPKRLFPQHSASPKNVIPLENGFLMEDQLTIVDDTTFVGLSTMGLVFDSIFTFLPDCVMTYEDSHIRYVPNQGTFIHTPFTFFGTVVVPEEILLEEGEIRDDINIPFVNQKNMKTVEFEFSCLSVLHFDENNQLVFKQENFFPKRILGTNARIDVASIWNYILKKSKSNIAL